MGYGYRYGYGNKTDGSGYGMGYSWGPVPDRPRHIPPRTSAPRTLSSQRNAPVTEDLDGRHPGTLIAGFFITVIFIAVLAWIGFCALKIAGVV
ncbi:hypothetical protein [Actinoallomurus iriomotensis]|uniref:Uncharacterized protein n=1 Tax=Actinoallomurus iriomotensis TaxID=478107 RepID=A0A9W6RRZ1_9ACTN|nr:hypothetical protein [Actinoallomurus iriomotensis]GLY80505.1 hypothetical protein Airi01_087720 [Actinoallomurus iriomotensis]